MYNLHRRRTLITWPMKKALPAALK